MFIEGAYKVLRGRKHALSQSTTPSRENLFLGGWESCIASPPACYRSLSGCLWGPLSHSGVSDLGGGP